VKEASANLARQSLARTLTPSELELATALESILTSGDHSAAGIVAELHRRGIRRPSGEAGQWSAATLEHELREINASLDAAYRK